MEYTDTTIMPWGMYKGKALANIPASYFIYLLDNKKLDAAGPLHRYVIANLDALKKEAANNNRYNAR